MAKGILREEEERWEYVHVEVDDEQHFKINDDDAADECDKWEFEKPVNEKDIRGINKEERNSFRFMLRRIITFDYCLYISSGLFFVSGKDIRVSDVLLYCSEYRHSSFVHLVCLL